METVVDTTANEAFVALDAHLDALFAAGPSPANRTDAVAWIEAAEHIGRRVDARRVEVLAAVDDAGWHRYDGHPSGRAMVEHVAHLSASESMARERSRRICIELPGLRTAFGSGQVGADQVRLLGRIHANRHVRDHMEARDHWFTAKACQLSFRDFEKQSRNWERLVDTGKRVNANPRNHEDRDAHFRHDSAELRWDLLGSYGSGQGASMAEIHQACIDAELHADW